MKINWFAVTVIALALFSALDKMVENICNRHTKSRRNQEKQS